MPVNIYFGPACLLAACQMAIGVKDVQVNSVRYRYTAVYLVSVYIIRALNFPVMANPTVCESYKAKLSSVLSYLY